MKKIILIFLGVNIWFSSLGQTIEKYFYNSLSFKKEVSEKKAKYSKTIITEVDGATITEVYDLKNKKILSRSGYKVQEQIGKWIIQRGNGVEEIDYDFSLIYSKEECNDSSYYKVESFFNNNDAEKYSAPKPMDSSQHFYSFLVRNMIYPSYARENNIQGKVYIKFFIDRYGAISDVCIFKGLHISLDKEAVRVIKLLRFSSPPKLNGQPVNICVILPITFRLA
ncbi:MAG: energy transducer TonB [Bacteroidota bacterium]